MAALSYAYPRVVAAVNSVTTPNNTSHTVTLQAPLTGPIRAGQLLIAIVGTDGTPGITWPDGWIRLGGNNNVSVHLEIYYRIADGTEGSTMTLTTSASEELTATILHVQRHGSSTNPPEADINGGNSTSPNPAGITPSGGSNDYMWVAGYVADGPNISASPFPATNYPFGVNHRSSGGVDACTMAVTKRGATASSENPGAMAIGGGAVDWLAFTIAVYPGDEGLPTVPQISDVVTTATSGTSHVLTLPSFSPGDLLIASAGFDGTPTITWPAGWTTLCADTSGVGVRMGVRYRIATGTEGSTITLSTSVSEEGTGIIYAVVGHDPARAPTGTISSGAGQSASGPGHSVGSLADRLWIGGATGDTATFFAQYPNIIQEPVAGLQSSAAAGACTQYSAYRMRHADSQSISSLRFAASVQWVAWTGSIHAGSITLPPGGNTSRRDRAHPHFYRPNVHLIPRRIRH